MNRVFLIAISLLILAFVLQKFFIIAILAVGSVAISFFIGTFQMAKSIGIELVTFTAVLTGFVFGPVMGAIIALVLIILHLIIGQFSAGPYILWVIPAYVTMGFLSGTLTGDISFDLLGIYLTLAINLFNLILTVITFPQNLGNYLPFSVTNILFNFLLFSQLGLPLASLIK